MTSIDQATNLAQAFHFRAQLTPQMTALMFKSGGSWNRWSWLDVENRVYILAAHLMRRGVEPGDCVAIMSHTRPEWFLLDLAIMSIGAVTVPVYPAVTADDAFAVLVDCNPRLVFVENQVQFLKVESIRPRLERCETPITLEQGSSPSVASVESWLRDSGVPDRSSSTFEKWRSYGDSLSGNSLASIVYTSGTMGNPKGALLTHGNFISVLDSLTRAFSISERDISLYFLPSAHIMGRIEALMSVYSGLVNAYVVSLSTLMDDLVDVRPSILLSVPRVFEKIYLSIRQKFSAEFWPVRKGFDLALAEALHFQKRKQNGEAIPISAMLKKRLNEELFFNKIRDRLGGRLRFAIGGGAPFSKDIAEFFLACGVLVLEGYGLSESTGPVCINRPNEFRLGTVGKPLPSCELKLAEDGEILLKGGSLMKKYHGAVGEAETFDSEGWFKTGDIGQLDEQGFLLVTDRKKDILVTAGGKNIAPQKIEALIKLDPLFSNVMLIGDNRKYIAALVTLHVPELKTQLKSFLAGLQHGEDPSQSPQVIDLVSAHIDKTNEKLAPFEQIRRFKIIGREFSIEAGELTPSLKVRRRFCSQKYAHLIEEMYNS